MNLYPQQKNTIRYLENRCTNQHGLLVFHHMGTGKTNTAIAWLINRQRKYLPSNTSTKKQPVKTHTVRHRHIKRSKHRIKKKSSKKRSRHGGGNHTHRESSSSSSTSTQRNISSGHTQSKKTSISKRKFEYVIVCPDTIKSTWIDESATMGFDLDQDCLMDYDQVEGMIQAKKLDMRGKNIIFDEAHNLCPIMRRENMRFYPEVIGKLKQADKLLLLTGTPEHKHRSDFTILINLAVGRNEFPFMTKNSLKNIAT